MAGCHKKKHNSKFDAMAFFQTQPNFKPYYAYKCPNCGYWHNTTKGISQVVLDQMREIIQTRDDDRKTFIEKLSNTVSTYKIHHHIGTFIVSYHNKTKNVEILSEEVR